MYFVDMEMKVRKRVVKLCDGVIADRHIVEVK
jgi:hypothetical protein